MNVPAVTAFRIVNAAAKSEREFDARLIHGKVDLYSPRAFIHREFREVRTFRRAFSLLREEAAFDVVQFLDADAVALVFALHTMMKRRHARQTALLANLHVASLLKPGESLKGRPLEALYRYSLGRLIREDLDALIVLDEAFKREIATRLKLSEDADNRVHFIPHGMDEVYRLNDKEGARRRLNLSQHETIFLLFGILRKDKRIDLALEAIKGLPCHLLIAGEPHDYDAAAVQELIRTRGCEESVSTDIRYIGADRMHDYFLASDAVILPYAADFNGQSGILTFACAHGRSVIASDVAAMGPTVREAGMGFVVEPESAEQLREAVQKFLLLGPEDRLQMEARSRLVATALSWNSICSQLEDIYSEILNRKRGGALVGHKCGD